MSTNAATFTPNDLRGVASLTFGFLCFLLLAFFQGSGINVFFLCMAVLSLLVALGCVGSERLARGILAQPAAALLGGLGGLSLILSYQFSLSKDSSFIPALALGLTPLGFLLALGFGEARARFGWLIRAGVLAFAGASVVFLVLRGARAHLPLSDPNNYASLIYLVLLPWIHTYLVGRWQGRPLSVGREALLYLAFFVLLMALFSTQSRAGALIFAVATIVWFVLALVRGLSLRPVLWVGLCAVLAFALSGWLYVGMHAQGNGNSGEALATGVEVRWSLISAALSMYGERPFTGIGIYVFPLLYRHYRTAADQDTAGLLAHSDYMQFLAEGGLLLFSVLVAFGLAVSVRLFRNLQHDVTSRRFSDVGVLLALGAVLGHAAINFVFYTPVLAFLIGILAAEPFSRPVSSQTPVAKDLFSGTAAILPEMRPEMRPELRWGLLAGLAWLWVCWLYLALDTTTYGVLRNQPGVPFTASFRDNPERMLAYARTAQRLNGNRGVPVLAEAAFLGLKLQEEPGNEYLEEQTLDALRRAMATDPWNPNAVMQMYQFVMARPALQSRLKEDEKPDVLLLRTIGIDPLYVPGLDVLVNRYVAIGRQDVAVTLLRTRVLPNIGYLMRTNADAALRYVGWLIGQAGADNDQSTVTELQALRDELDKVQVHTRPAHY